jgi:phosphopantothenoylcysteine synthetase/decarboxylase
MNANKLNILIGSCGAINILNLHNYLAYFAQFANSINVILTASAARMIQVSAIQAVTRCPVFQDELTAGISTAHINLAKQADLFIVIPATANILGKAANGIADDLLSSAIIAFPRSIYFVPAMNEMMWQKTVVQRNVVSLQTDGHYIVLCQTPHKVVEIATGETVLTKLMPSPVETMEFIQQQLNRDKSNFSTTSRNTSQN